MFPYDAGAVAELCSELDQWRTQLDRRGSLQRRWAGRLRRELEAEAVAASTSMEGVPVTVEEVHRILAGQPPREVRPEDRRLVEGYRDAMAFVLRRADDPAFTWNRELLVALHDRVLAGRHDLGAGRLRVDSPAYIVSGSQEIFRPPPGEEVVDLVEGACARLEEGHPHPSIAAAWIHVAIAGIHPFRDGNGRVARVMASLAMYRGGFRRPEFTSLEEWWGKHRDDYYAMFACLRDAFDPQTPVTPFVRAHVAAQVRQVRALDLRERVEHRVWIALEEIAEGSSLDRRVANALWEAFWGRDVTAGYYRSLADVSPATATKDLGAAVAAGLLGAEGQRKARRYLPTDRLVRAAASFLNVPSEGTPEAARQVIVSELGRRLVDSPSPPDL